MEILDEYNNVRKYVPNQSSLENKHTYLWSSTVFRFFLGLTLKNE